MSRVCSCGITYQQVDIDGKLYWYCPRCNEQVLQCAHEVERVTGIRPNEVRTAEGCFTLLNYACELCGTLMPDACHAVCPNCGWQKSCD